jgi:uncharacterized protein (TIGR02452 family)
MKALAPQPHDPRTTVVHIAASRSSEEPPRWWPSIRNALAILATVFTFGLAYIFSETIRSYVDMTFTTPQPSAAGRAPLPPARLPTAPPVPVVAAAARPEAPGRLFVVPNPNSFPGVDDDAKRANLFKDTLRAIQYGYKIGNIEVKPNIERTKKETEFSRALQTSPAKPAGIVTKFVVSQKTTTQAILELASIPGVKPLALNMANAHKYGGGVIDGRPAQEECMCRETSLYLSLKQACDRLKSSAYPIPANGSIYSGHVEVVRDPTKQFAFLEHPVPCAFVSVAAPDLRKGSRDRVALGLHLMDPIDQRGLETNIEYRNRLEETIVQLLRHAAQKGHTHLVLGALGCGAFEGLPSVTAQLFHQVLNSPEFENRFTHVEFAIYCARGSRRDAANLLAFQKAFAQP